MSFKSLNWLRDGLLPFSIAIMITCWLSPWMLWVKGWTVFAYESPILSPLSMAAILTVSAFATKILLRQDWPLERVQGLVIGLGLVTILVFVKVEYYGAYFFLDPRWLGDLVTAFGHIFGGIPPQLAGLLLGAYLWWRGIGLGRESVDFDDVFKAFRLGIVMLIGLLILSVLSVHGEGSKTIQGQAIPAVLVFFLFSLLALSLSRLEAAREEARMREERAMGWNRDWLVMVVTSIIAIVFVGFALSSIFSFDLASKLLGMLLQVAELITISLFFVILLLGYVAEVLIYFLRLILWLLRITPNPEKLDPPDSLFGERGLRESTEARIPPQIVQAIEWAVLVAIIAVVGLLVVKAIFRLRRQQTEEDVEEVHESLWSWQTFVDDVKSWLSSLWLRLVARRRAASRAASTRSLQLGPQFQISVSIRQIYQSLLSHAAHLGFPKQPEETPFEYLKVLAGALPAGRDDLAAITEAYVVVRYSGQPAQAPEFQAVDAAWSRLRAVLKLVEEAKAEEGKRRSRPRHPLWELS